MPSSIQPPLLMYGYKATKYYQGTNRSQSSQWDLCKFGRFDLAALRDCHTLLTCLFVYPPRPGTVAQWGSATHKGPA
jgi:hypothetical protein